MKQHTLRAVTDMLALTPDEFERMLPDLIVWYRLCKAMGDVPGMTHIGFTWVDDGDAGGMSGITVRSAQTGEVLETWKP